MAPKYRCNPSRLWAQSTDDILIGGHINVLSITKKLYQINIMLFYYYIAFCQNHILLALLKCKHVRCPSILIKSTTYFCNRRVVYKKGLKLLCKQIIHCLTCVITLQILRSNYSTGVSTFLYPFHIKMAIHNFN